MSEDESVDLFEDQDSLPDEIRETVMHYSWELEASGRDPYEVSREFLGVAESLGYTFEYGLDGVPYGLQPKDASPTT